MSDWRSDPAYNDSPIVEPVSKVSETEERRAKCLPVACGYWDAARKAGYGWECRLLLDWVIAERDGDLEFFKTNRAELQRICEELKPVVLREKEKVMTGSELEKEVRDVFKDGKDGSYRG